MKTLGRIILVLVLIAVGYGVARYALARTASAETAVMQSQLEAARVRADNAETRVKELTDNPIRVTEVVTKVVEVPVEKIVEKVVETPQIAIVEADQVCNLSGNLPAYCDFRAAVREPGDTAKFIIRFTEPMTNVVLSRVWPDDILEGISFQTPGGNPQDLMASLGMFVVTKTQPADVALRGVLKARGVNIDAGELLPQNKNQVHLGNVPKGSILTFFVKDDASKGVNRGMGATITDQNDPFTVGMDGKPVK